MKETDEKLQSMDENKKPRPSSAQRTSDPLVRSLKGPNGLPPKKEEPSADEVKHKLKEAEKKVSE